MLNVDHFHMINEMFGRDMGDEILKKIANALMQIFGSGMYIGCRPDADYTREVNFYSKELNDADLFHERLIHDIDDAIANRNLTVFYQPKYGIQSEKPELRSAEALIRWKHPELGMISPGEFIPLFESNGLIQMMQKDSLTWLINCAPAGLR